VGDLVVTLDASLLTPGFEASNISVEGRDRDVHETPVS